MKSKIKHQILTVCDDNLKVIAEDTLQLSLDDGY